MKTEKVHYHCSNCNYTTVKWVGYCPSCSEWNSMIKNAEIKSSYLAKNKASNIKAAKLFSLKSINIEAKSRMFSNIKEWDRVLGGGVLPGSFLILTGDPGIGKSTLLLQVANNIATNHKVIYFSSEESLEQVKRRAIRLNCDNENLLFSDQASLESIIATAIDTKPDLLILDSIQNCHLEKMDSVPGTIGQLRETGFHLMRIAKEHNIAILVTGHITKEGYMAGPKLLEHMVDGLFYLQGEDRWQTRILRSVKNRFGTINEIGFFEMQECGMQEISDINRHFLSEETSSLGAALITSIEGSRPLILELQSLCIPSKFGMPQRIVTGVDPKQIILIAAILEKYLKIKFSGCDIFFKVSGGLKIKDSGIDLGIALALLSSYFQKSLPEKSISMAEISLTGKIKPTIQIERRIKEAEKFGIKKIFLSNNQNIKTKCNTVNFKNIYELLNLFPEEN